MASRDIGRRAESALATNAADLLAYFVRRTYSAEDAADMLSDTVLAVWRRRVAVPDDDTEARMWMFGIARNVLMTQTRTKRRRSALQEKLRVEIADGSQVVADTAHLDVRAALGGLDRLDQEIIRLAYWDGFSLAHVARLLHMPEGTVRSRHHRARGELRRLLGPTADEHRPSVRTPGLT